MVLVSKRQCRFLIQVYFTFILLFVVLDLPLSNAILCFPKTKVNGFFHFTCQNPRIGFSQISIISDSSPAKLFQQLLWLQQPIFGLDALQLFNHGIGQHQKENHRRAGVNQIHGDAGGIHRDESSQVQGQS